MENFPQDFNKAFSIGDQLLKWKLTIKHLKDLSELCSRRTAPHPGMLFVHYYSAANALRKRPCLEWPKIANDFRTQGPALRQDMVRYMQGTFFRGNIITCHMTCNSHSKLVQCFLTRLHSAKHLVADHPEWHSLPEELLWVPLDAIQKLLIGKKLPEETLLVWRVDFSDKLSRVDWVAADIKFDSGDKSGLLMNTRFVSMVERFLEKSDAQEAPEMLLLLRSIMIKIRNQHDRGNLAWSEVEYNEHELKLWFKSVVQHARLLPGWDYFFVSRPCDGTREKEGEDDAVKKRQNSKTIKNDGTREEEDEDDVTKKLRNKVKTRPAHATAHWQTDLRGEMEPRLNPALLEEEEKATLNRRARRQESRRQQTEDARRHKEKAAAALEARRTVLVKPPEDKELPPEDAGRVSIPRASEKADKALAVKLQRDELMLVRSALSVPCR